MPDKLLFPNLKEIEVDNVNSVISIDYESMQNTKIGVMAEDGSIQATSYQLSNIHEFLKAFYQPNTHE